MTRSHLLNHVVAVALCLSVLAWGGWLWQMRKTQFDYILADARHAPPIPMCQWVHADDDAIASLGLSKGSPPAWTDSTVTLLAFRTTPAQPWYVDVAVPAIAGAGITISADGRAPQPLSVTTLPKTKVLRLPLTLRTADDVHTVTIHIADAKPPSGHEQRWLGVAISGIRVCDKLGGR